MAVCLLPGTELAFDDDVQYERALSLFGKVRINHKVARFRQVNMSPRLLRVMSPCADQSRLLIGPRDIAGTWLWA